MVALFFLATGIAQAARQQSPDNPQARPPVSKSDVKIVERARQILDSPEKWNRADNRVCPDAETKFSLYCALEKATYDVMGDFTHRGAAMQEARFVIDDDLAPKNNYHHRLMDYNNDPHTTFRDVQRFFDFLQGRIEARLQDQDANLPPSVKPALATVTEADVEIVKKVEKILDSSAKWDKASTQECKKNAQTFGLYCAFKAASLAVTGKFDDRAPGIMEARRLIGSTDNGASYSARLVDYNNDATVKYEDLQRLLKTVENNLEKRVALESK
jgi:hypothetical protein